jgi:hypothetical protein
MSPSSDEQSGVPSTTAPQTTSDFSRGATIATQPTHQRSELPSSTARRTTTSQENSEQLPPTQPTQTEPPLSAGAQCTADSQCKQPNICLTDTQSATCCDTAIPSCPGAPCSGINDCQSPYGCLAEFNICCGYPPFVSLVGPTCYPTS